MQNYLYERHESRYGLLQDHIYGAPPISVCRLRERRLWQIQEQWKIPGSGSKLQGPPNPHSQIRIWHSGPYCNQQVEAMCHVAC